MILERPTHTIGSAIIWEGDNVAFKEIHDGKDDGKLSFPGGYMDWGMGFPGCLTSRVYDENRLAFTPRQLRMIQTISASGKSILNLNVTGPVADRTRAKDTVWLDWRYALRNPGIFRTRDTLSLLRMQNEASVLDLGFVQTVGILNGRTEGFDYDNPGDFIVTSSVVRNLQDGDYAFAIAGQEERTPGKVGLFGGRFNGLLESLQVGGKRELGEEAGLYYKYPAGMAGLLVSPRPGRDAVSNLVICYEVPDRNSLYVPDDMRGEVAEIRWLSLGALLSYSLDNLRSADVPRAVSLADYSFARRSLVPFESIPVVSAAA